MSTEAIKRFCNLKIKEKCFLISAAKKYKLSARSYFRVLKLARTIADLDNQEEIGLNHLAEALQYRPKLE